MRFSKNLFFLFPLTTKSHFKKSPHIFFVVEQSTSSFSNTETQSNTKSQREIELENMLNGLKDKFSSLEDNDPFRLRILTTAPDTWTISQISQEFNCSRYFAKKAKELKALKGVLGETTAKMGKPLPETTKTRINDFYNSEKNSRIMPGIKDVISVKTDKDRKLIQKRLLLADLRGLFALYSKENLDCLVSFSKFAQLRPKHCILAGGNGTHSVCVCTIHQNCKLMIDSVNFKNLTKDSEMILEDYKDCLRQILCEQPVENCYLGECDKCPGTMKLENHLKKLLEETGICNVQFSVWTNTDRSTLQTQIIPSSEFVDELCDKLIILKPHSFIAKEQSRFYQERKMSLKSGEVLIVLDFSENYKYVVQDASQGFHFNNSQCTVFPVVCYYNEGSKLTHKSFIFLSNSTLHDTAAVYTAQKILIPELKRIIPKLRRIIYFSDGAKQHFKNKYQMMNLMHHNDYFSVEAEWNCYATAHGKGPSDGVGAEFKKEAVHASLLCKPNDAIHTFEKFVDWAKRNSKSVDIFS